MVSVDISNGYSKATVAPASKSLARPVFRAAGSSCGLGGDTQSLYYKAGLSQTQKSNPAFTLTFSQEKG